MADLIYGEIVLESANKRNQYRLFVTQSRQPAASPGYVSLSRHWLTCMST